LGSLGFPTTAYRADAASRHAKVFTDSLPVAADTAGVRAGGKPAMIIRARASSHARHIA